MTTPIDNLIIQNVTTNVIHITLAIISVYPCIYILRNMIDFTSQAFSKINLNLKIPTFSKQNVDVNGKPNTKFWS